MKPIHDPNSFRALKNIQIDILKKVGTNFTGSSPPDVFVGEYNYPNVFAGILAPIKTSNEEVFDSPEQWFQKRLSVYEILIERGRMIYPRFVQQVKSQNGKLISLMQEVSMANKSTDINFDLIKKPTINLKLDNMHAPVFNPAKLRTAKLESNPSITKRVEYIVGDHHLKAGDSIIDLYQHKLPVTNIIKLLSAGTLGIATQRRLVPTKWAITATDNIISESMIEQLKYFPWINNIELYHDAYLGNDYRIILLPRQWSFEVIEAKYNQEYSKIQFWQDYESHEGRTTYASSVVGGYYAARVAVAEHLIKRKRQASVLIMRQIKGYDTPCGVGVLRELTRNALSMNPEKCISQDDAFKKAQEGLALPITLFKERSKLLKDIKSQKTLAEY